MLGMFYKYNVRMDEFKRVSQIKNPRDKITALEQFIDQEKEILKKMTPPAPSSQALTSAQIALASVQGTVGRTQSEKSFINYLCGLVWR